MWEGRLSGNQQGLVIKQVVLGAGSGISDNLTLEVADRRIRKRYGRVRIRMAKGKRTRAIPVKVHIGRALQAYLKIRQEGNEAYQFLGRLRCLNGVRRCDDEWFMSVSESCR